MYDTFINIRYNIIYNNPLFTDNVYNVPPLG